ncbi:MAG: hypothetical protein WDN75_14090 [Bacteroidota bacterium]
MFQKGAGERWAIVLLLSAAYLILSFFLIGFKIDQLVLIAIVGALFLISSGTRRFIISFSPFIVFWIIFDYMKAFPNYLFNEVHIKDLYDAELFFFGINAGDVIMTPGEFCIAHHFPLGDVLAGIFYLCWIPVPLLFNAYLFFFSREQSIHFGPRFSFCQLYGVHRLLFVSGGTTLVCPIKWLRFLS